MKPTHGNNPNCTCSSCYYKNASEMPSLKNMLAHGTKIDKLYFGKYVPLREQKLLDRLIRTRAVYDDIRRELISKSKESINDVADLRVQKVVQPSGSHQNVLELVNLVDKGALSPQSLSECCSCCVCDSISRAVGHAAGGRSAGQTAGGRFKHRHRHSQSTLRSSEVSGHMRHRDERRIGKYTSHKTKNIQSDPGLKNKTTNLGRGEHAQNTEHYTTTVSKGGTVRRIYQRVEEYGTGEAGKTRVDELGARKRSMEKIREAERKLSGAIGKNFKKFVERNQHRRDVDAAGLLNLFETTFGVEIPDSIEVEVGDETQRQKILDKFACDFECDEEVCEPEMCIEKKRRTLINEKRRAPRGVKKGELGRIDSSLSTSAAGVQAKKKYQTTKTKTDSPKAKSKKLSYETEGRLESRKVEGITCACESTETSVEAESADVAVLRKSRSVKSSTDLLSQPIYTKKLQMRDKYQETGQIIKKKHHRPHKTVKVPYDLKRCFCTLNIKPKKLRSNINQTSSQTSVSKFSQTPNLRLLPRLLSYECEPNVCIPGQCNPMECEVRIRKRNQKYRDAITSVHYPTPRSKSTPNVKVKAKHKRTGKKYSDSTRFTLTEQQHSEINKRDELAKQVSSVGSNTPKMVVIRGKTAKSAVKRDLRRCFCTLKLTKHGHQKPYPRTFLKETITPTEKFPVVYRRPASVNKSTQLKNDKLKSLHSDECECPKYFQIKPKGGQVGGPVAGRVGGPVIKIGKGVEIRRRKRPFKSTSSVTSARKPETKKSRTTEGSMISASPRRQAVRVSSSFSFSIEFSKNKPTDTFRHYEHDHQISSARHKTTDQTKRKLVHKDQITQSQTYPYRIKTSSTEAQTKHKKVTIKLNKPIKPDKLTKTVHASTEEFPKIILISKGTKTKNKQIYQQLEPYECEPYFCVPGECDPYKCLDRIKMRNKSKHKDFGVSTSGNMISISSSTNKTKRKGAVIQSEPLKKKRTRSTYHKSSSVDSKQIQAYVKPTPMQQKTEGRTLSRGVRISSTVSFEVEFCKYAQKDFERVHKMTKPKAKPLKYVAGSTMTTSFKESPSQARMNIMTNKGSETKPVPKRCFCTLKLQKKQTPRKPKDIVTRPMQATIMPAQLFYENVKLSKSQLRDAWLSENGFSDYSSSDILSQITNKEYIVNSQFKNQKIEIEIIKGLSTLTKRKEHRNEFNIDNLSTDNFSKSVMRSRFYKRRNSAPTTGTNLAQSRIPERKLLQNKRSINRCRKSQSVPISHYKSLRLYKNRDDDGKLRLSKKCTPITTDYLRKSDQFIIHTAKIEQKISTDNIYKSSVKYINAQKPDSDKLTDSNQNQNLIMMQHNIKNDKSSDIHENICQSNKIQSVDINTNLKEGQYEKSKHHTQIAHKNNSHNSTNMTNKYRLSNETLRLRSNLSYEMEVIEENSPTADELETDAATYKLKPQLKDIIKLTQNHETNLLAGKKNSCYEKYSNKNSLTNTSTQNETSKAVSFLKRCYNALKSLSNVRCSLRKETAGIACNENVLVAIQTEHIKNNNKLHEKQVVVYQNQNSMQGKKDIFCKSSNISSTSHPCAASFSSCEKEFTDQKHSKVPTVYDPRHNFKTKSPTHSQTNIQASKTCSHMKRSPFKSTKIFRGCLFTPSPIKPSEFGIRETSHERSSDCRESPNVCKPVLIATSKKTKLFKENQSKIDSISNTGNTIDSNSHNNYCDRKIKTKSNHKYDTTRNKHKTLHPEFKSYNNSCAENESINKRVLESSSKEHKSSLIIKERQSKRENQKQSLSYFQEHKNRSKSVNRKFRVNSNLGFPKKYLVDDGETRESLKKTRKDIKLLPSNEVKESNIQYTRKINGSSVTPFMKRCFCRNKAKDDKMLSKPKKSSSKNSNNKTLKFFSFSPKDMHNAENDHLFQNEIKSKKHNGTLRIPEPHEFETYICLPKHCNPLENFERNKGLIKKVKEKSIAIMKKESGISDNTACNGKIVADKFINSKSNQRIVKKIINKPSRRHRRFDSSVASVQNRTLLRFGSAVKFNSDISKNSYLRNLDYFQNDKASRGDTPINEDQNASLRRFSITQQNYEFKKQDIKQIDKKGKRPFFKKCLHTFSLHKVAKMDKPWELITKHLEDKNKINNTNKILNYYTMPMNYWNLGQYPTDPYQCIEKNIKLPHRPGGTKDISCSNKCSITSLTTPGYKAMRTKKHSLITVENQYPPPILNNYKQGVKYSSHVKHGLTQDIIKVSSNYPTQYYIQYQIDPQRCPCLHPAGMGDSVKNNKKYPVKTKNTQAIKQSKSQSKTKATNTKKKKNLENELRDGRMETILPYAPRKFNKHMSKTALTSPIQTQISGGTCCSHCGCSKEKCENEKTPTLAKRLTNTPEQILLKNKSKKKPGKGKLKQSKSEKSSKLPRSDVKASKSLKGTPQYNGEAPINGENTKNNKSGFKVNKSSKPEKHITGNGNISNMNGVKVNPQNKAVKLPEFIGNNQEYSGSLPNDEPCKPFQSGDTANAILDIRNKKLKCPCKLPAKNKKVKFNTEKEKDDENEEEPIKNDEKNKAALEPATDSPPKINKIKCFVQLLKCLFTNKISDTAIQIVTREPDRPKPITTIKIMGDNIYYRVDQGGGTRGTCPAKVTKIEGKLDTMQITADGKPISTGTSESKTKYKAKDADKSKTGQKNGHKKSKDVAPCVCGSTVCSSILSLKRLFRLDLTSKKEKDKAKAKKQKPCVCGSKVCKAESQKMSGGLDIKAKEKQKANKEKQEIEKNKEKDKKERKKQKEKIEQFKLKEKEKKRKQREREKHKCKCAEYLRIEEEKVLQALKKLEEKKRKKILIAAQLKKRQQQYKKADALRRKERRKKDKHQLKLVKKYRKKGGNVQLLAESVADIGLLGCTTATDLLRSGIRTVFDPRNTYYTMKTTVTDPKRACRACKDAVADSGVASTLKRVTMRTTAMSWFQELVAKLEQYRFTHYLININNPKKRATFKKRQKRMKEPIDFQCSLYMASLRKRPCLAVYYTCPWFYPHCVSLLNAWRQFTDIVLFLLAVVVWSPCIFLMEALRALLCCTICTA